MERYQQAIDTITFINENFLEGIANSTGIRPGLKQFILNAMRNFNINIQERNFLAIKEKLSEEYRKKNGRRPEETIAGERLVHTIDVTSLIIIIYKLTNFAPNTKGDFVDFGDSNITDEFLEDAEIEEFLKLYLENYVQIKLWRYTFGWQYERICSELKQSYNGINCTLLDRWISASRVILSLFNRHRGNQYRHKYLKYKKKYLNAKNKITSL